MLAIAILDCVHGVSSNWAKICWLRMCLKAKLFWKDEGKKCYRLQLFIDIPSCNATL